MSYPQNQYGVQPGGPPLGSANPYPGMQYGAPPKPGQSMTTGGVATGPPTNQMQGLTLQPGANQQPWAPGQQQPVVGVNQTSFAPPPPTGPSPQPLLTRPPISVGAFTPGGGGGGPIPQPNQFTNGGQMPPPPSSGSYQPHPPTSLTGPPPTSLTGPPPTSLTGPPPTSLSGPYMPPIGGQPGSMTGVRAGMLGPPRTTGLQAPPTSSQPSGPPMSSQPSGPPMSSQLSGPPMSSQPSGPPMSSQLSGPPMSSQSSGPPMSSQLSGPPMFSQPSGPPMFSQPSGPPMSSQPSGPPMSSQLSGPPMFSQPSGPPMSSQLSGPLMSSQSSGPPMFSQPSGPPMSSQLSGPLMSSQPSGPPMFSQPSGPPMSSQLSGPPMSSQLSGPLMSSQSSGPPMFSQPSGPPMSSQSSGPPMSSQLSGPPMSSQTPQGSVLGPSAVPPQPAAPYAGVQGPSGQTIYRGQGPPPGPSNQPPPHLPAMNAGMPPGPLAGSIRPMGQLAPQQQLPEELRPCNLLETRYILPSEPIRHPTINLPGEYAQYQPDPNVICSTLTAVPVTSNLLSKVKLPFGIHVHPFRRPTARSLPILQPAVIVRCRVCRTYINPYVTFISSRQWRCNLCFRPNDLPEDFNFNPQTGAQGRAHRKELTHATVEYLASSEYMLRPPQPCTYFFAIDVSHTAVSSGMLATVCATLLENLDRLPGDARTLVGVMTFDRNLHFYNMQSSLAQFQMLTVCDLEEVFIPIPSSLLVNLRDNKSMIKTVLEELPKIFANNSQIDSALGAAMTAACKILSPVGGRVSVFTSSTPSVGPGATKSLLTAESTSSVSKEKLNVAPATDFYKKLALECYTQQTGIDLFFFSQQPIGYASIACAAQVSSGQVYYYPGFHSNDAVTRDRFVTDLTHYLTRPIGFEAVMRIRCTQGLGLHAFHGNFFVRSSDLLSLPNVSPDMGYAVNLSIDESLKDLQNQMVCVQTALLYTSSKGERRIRVHTIALPVTDKPAEVFAGCDVQAVIGLLAKMGADRIANATLGDAREALVNAVSDCIKAYKSSLNSSSFLSIPSSLRLFPLFTLSLMKHPAFSLDSRTTVDARADAMNTLKTLPLDALMVHIYPHLCCLSSLTEEMHLKMLSTGSHVVPERLHNTAAKLQRNAIFLLDCGSEIMIWVGQGTSPDCLQSLFGIGTYPDVDDSVHALSSLDNPLSRLTKQLLQQLRRTQTKTAVLRIVKETSPSRYLLADRLVEDKTEGGFSYQEFLQMLSNQFKKK